MNAKTTPPEETEEYWIAKGAPEFPIPTWKPGDPLPESRPWRPMEEFDESKVTCSGQRYLEIRDGLTGRYRHERALAQARREWSEDRTASQPPQTSSGEA